MDGRVGQNNTPDEQQLKASLVEGLLPEIKHNVIKHCIHVDRGRLEDVLAHARHMEKVVKQAGDKVTKKKEKLGERLMMAQLQALEQQARPSWKQEYGRGHDQGRDRGGQQWLLRDGCYRCGSLSY